MPGFWDRIIGKLLDYAQQPTVRPASRRLRVFLLRTGEYAMTDAAVGEWQLTPTGQAQAASAADKIRQRLGGHTPTMINFLESDLAYRQTILVVARQFGVEPVWINEGIARVPLHGSSLEWFASLGEALVMVIDGTNLTDMLVRFGGSLEGLGTLGPPHGSVHELVITYQPSTPLLACEVLDCRFV